MEDTYLNMQKPAYVSIKNISTKKTANSLFRYVLVLVYHCSRRWRLWTVSFLKHEPLPHMDLEWQEHNKNVHRAFPTFCWLANPCAKIAITFISYSVPPLDITCPHRNPANITRPMSRSSQTWSVVFFSATCLSLHYRDILYYFTAQFFKIHGTQNISILVLRIQHTRFEEPNPTLLLVSLFIADTW